VPPTATPATSNFSIQLKSGDTNSNTNSPHPQIRIQNTGSAALNLNSVEARYWLNYDAAAGTVQAFVDWAGRIPSGQTISQNVTASVYTTNKGGQSHYVSIKFINNVTLQPGESAEVQFRFNKADWSMMLQTNDWSFAANTAFTVTGKVTGYVNGGLVWGNEPVATAVPSAQVAEVYSYPNPANSTTGTTLSYTITAPTTGVSAQSVNDTIYIPDPSAKVYMKIYTGSGRLIWQTVLEGASNISTGEHIVKWDGKSAGGHALSAGTYTLKVEIKDGSGVSAAFSRIIMMQ
jgi:hypothetical protein